MFVVDLQLTGASKLKDSVVNEIIRESLRDVGEYWHEHMLPKHFTKAGAREYGYTPRRGEPGSGRAFKGSYTAHKLKKKGHALPLVYSGETRQRLLSTKSIEARTVRRGARAHVTIRLNAPQLNQNSSKVKKHEEIRKVSHGELNTLANYLVSRIEMRLTAAGKANAAGLASITAG